LTSECNGRTWSVVHGLHRRGSCRRQAPLALEPPCGPFRSL
jgi:hypothetical protein